MIGINLGLLLCATLFFVSLILYSTTNGLSIIAVYAANSQINRCDITSTCIVDLGGDLNNQYNNCNRSSLCQSEIFGNSNSQYNNCATAACNNDIRGNSNSQYNTCANDAACLNGATGDSNTQNTACRLSLCRTETQFTNFNTQNTACQSSEACINGGTNTNVYSNGFSGICTSNGPETTTLCQQDRSFTFSNH